jgi:hypothetical protein
MTNKLLILVIILLCSTPVSRLAPQTNPDSIPFAPVVHHDLREVPHSIFCAEPERDKDTTVCIIQNDDGIATYYSQHFDSGSGFAVYMEPTGCGTDPPYSFLITGVHLYLYASPYDSLHYLWPVTIQVSVSDLYEDDKCNGPDSILSSEIFSIPSDSAYPKMMNLSFSESSSVHQPFFLEIKYLDHHAEGEALPSLVMDQYVTSADTCNNWGVIGGGYYEWSDFWYWLYPEIPQLPGDAMIRAAGSFKCGDLSFRPNPDGWHFGNTKSNMWPYTWWQQFNYCQYPYPWLWCLLCKSSDFPDWSLFVSAFGENQCYYDPPPGLVIYKPRAVLRWFALKDGWGGSCFGFAISSFLFFDDYLNISSEFPGYTQVYSVPINDQSRLMQNKYWIYQFGKAQQQYINANYNSTTPNQTLQACQSMFNASSRNDRILVMFNNHGSGGHALNAYRCEVDAENPEITHVYVYDNNFLGDESKRASINTSTNTWTYDGLPGWGGSKHLFLMDPVSNYMTNPVMPTFIPPRDRWISEKGRTTSEYVEFYVSSTDTAIFESPMGSIGYLSDSLFNNLPDGHPITPITGQETPPIGYYLPNDAWTCLFSGLSDSTFRLSLFTDSSVMVYWRTGVDSTQSEYLRYPGNDSTLLIHNPDSERRFYNLDVISSVPDSEIYYSITDISIDHADSTRYSIQPASQLKLDNYGRAKTYNLRIEIAGIDLDTIFFHEGITLDSNSSHLIVPDWRPYNDSLMILVDSGMVGSFSDTVFVQNQSEYLHGDANGDGLINSADIAYLINYLFIGGPAPEPLVAGDANCDGVVNSADVAYLINYLFVGGPPPGC